jgi:hypothetical protein
VNISNIKASISLSSSPLISKKSVALAIKQSSATSAMTITLHHDAYIRLADDSDVLSELAKKTLVTLVDASA